MAPAYTAWRIVKLTGRLGRDRAPRFFSESQSGAEKAIALDDSLAEAHVSLAMVRSAYEWDWSGAAFSLRYSAAVSR